MKISPTTSEDQLKERTLNLIYAQWADLGLPLSSPITIPPTEVIDPEALIWASLEFLPTDPRLREGVLAWIQQHRQLLIRQRLRTIAETGEPRAIIWQAIDSPAKSNTIAPTTYCHGLASQNDVIAFCNDITSTHNAAHRHAPVGHPTQKSSTVLVQARNVLGSDARHFILIYLLSNPSGALVRDIAAWSRYTYRSIADTISRWDTAGVVDTSHGFCRLNNPQQWKQLLRAKHSPTAAVDWFTAYDAVIHLLRAQQRATAKKLDNDNAVFRAHRHDAINTLSSATRTTPHNCPSITYLIDAIEDPTTQNQSA